MVLNNQCRQPDVGTRAALQTQGRRHRVLVADPIRRDHIRQRRRVDFRRMGLQRLSGIRYIYGARDRPAEPITKRELSEEIGVMRIILPDSEFCISRLEIDLRAPKTEQGVGARKIHLAESDKRNRGA